MRHLLLTSVAAVLLQGCIIVDLGDAHAAVSTQSVVGGDIQLTLDEDADFQISGADLVLRGRVAGALSLSGADIVGRDLRLGALDANAADLDFDGAVAGDVAINAADLVWRGDVDGAFNANMADGVLAGSFQSVRLNAADVHLRSAAEVNGALRVSAADLRVDGDVRRGLDAAVRSARIGGSVRGPFAIHADPGRPPYGRNDGRVEITGAIDGGFICARQVVISGQVSGRLEVVADEAPFIEGGSVQDISFTNRDGAPCRRPQG